MPVGICFGKRKSHCVQLFVAGLAAVSGLIVSTPAHGAATINSINTSLHSDSTFAFIGLNSALTVKSIETSGGAYAAGEVGNVAVRRAAGPNTDIIWRRDLTTTSTVALDTVALVSPQPVTVETILTTNNLLVGLDNAFANRGDGVGNNTNIERLDFYFGQGIVADRSRGFAIFDRGDLSDHDGFKIAAILSIDSNHVPTALGSVQTFGLGTWGNSDLSDDEYTVLRRAHGSDTTPFTPTNTVRNGLGGVFVPTSDLAQTGQTIYGFVLMAPDVTGTNLLDWTNTASYRNNTPNDNVSPSGVPYTQAGGGLDATGVSATLFEKVTSTPEPASLSLLCLGGLLLGRRSRRTR